MSDCCTLVLHQPEAATLQAVPAALGALQTEEGTTLQVTSQTTVLRAQYVLPTLVASPPVYQVYPESLVAYATRVDFDDVNNLIYKGEAVPGSDQADSVWRVRRLSFVGADEDVVEEWAGGTASFDKVWDDRLTLTYS